MPNRFEGCERLAIYISENGPTRTPQGTDDELFEWLKSSAFYRVEKDKARDEVRSEIMSRQSSFRGGFMRRVWAPIDFQSTLKPRYKKLLVDYQQIADNHYQASPRARANTPVLPRPCAMR